MKVKELKEMLSKINDEAIVILSKDGEGNDFSPLAGEYSQGVYQAESTWHGEFMSEECEDYEDDPAETSAVKAICLWPIN